MQCATWSRWVYIKDGNWNKTLLGAPVCFYIHCLLLKNPLIPFQSYHLYLPVDSVAYRPRYTLSLCYFGNVDWYLLRCENKDIPGVKLLTWKSTGPYVLHASCRCKKWYILYHKEQGLLSNSMFNVVFNHLCIYRRLLVMVAFVRMRRWGTFPSSLYLLYLFL